MMMPVRKSDVVAICFLLLLYSVATQKPITPAISREDHVAERFAHLLAAEPEHPAVHPEAHKRMPTGVGLGLGDLRGVVREDQVAPAAVDVDLIAEVTGRHRRTLDVPAGTPIPP